MKRITVLLAMTIGCAGPTGAPPLPEVRLSDDDVAVLTAAVGEEEGGALVAPDRTLRVCPPNDYRPESYECVDMRDLLEAEIFVRGLYGEAGVALLHSRNHASIQVQKIGRVRLRPARELLDLLARHDWPLVLPRRHPGARAVVLFTGPIYPTPGESVVYLLHPFRGAAIVHVVRQDTTWTVLKRYAIAYRKPRV